MRSIRTPEEMKRDYMRQLETGEKYCPRCKQWKIISENFGKTKYRYDGYRPHCKSCDNDIARKTKKNRPFDSTKTPAWFNEIQDINKL